MDFLFAPTRYEDDEPVGDLSSYFAFERDTTHGLVIGSKAQLAARRWGASRVALVPFRAISADDPDREVVARFQAENFVQDPKLGRAVASFCSMALGDALGCPMEFRAVRYADDDPIITDLDYKNLGSFGLQPGQWTDDASMGACIADSLLVCQGYDPFDMKVRFVNWWDFGYNNAFRNEARPQGSVGLGGNISMSFSEFYQKGTVYTTVGDEKTCGNGSLMRNGALAVFFHENLDDALAVARAQSRLTHRGTEAAECCALLTYLSHYAINHPGAGKDEVLSAAVTNAFASLTTCDSVQCLARSEQEPGDNPDRNWQWRAADYRYSPTRARQQPGYVGSYAMDALAMALHCVWSTSDYRTALVKAANRCGDADSVCDITGQLAGAIYGYAAIPPTWMAILNKWDDNDFAVKAFKMFQMGSRLSAERQGGRTIPANVLLDIPAGSLPQKPSAAAAAVDDSSDDAAPGSAVRM